MMIRKRSDQISVVEEFLEFEEDFLLFLNIIRKKEKRKKKKTLISGVLHLISLDSIFLSPLLVLLLLLLLLPLLLLLLFILILMEWSSTGQAGIVEGVDNGQLGAMVR